MAGSSYGEIAYRLNYEVSPITLVDGIAGGIPGSALGVVNLLLGSAFSGLAAPAGGTGLDTFGVTFLPLPGGSVVNNAIATYPFANIAAAANAIINQPLNISMLMRIPATLYIGGHEGRAAIFQALGATLQQHIANEGTFVVNTPMWPWSDCILTMLSDVSGGETRQTQVEWKWDFQMPLISADLSGYSMNTATGDVASGGTTDGTAGGGATTGNPATAASSPAVPNNAASPGAGVAVDNGPGGGAGFGGGSGGSPFSGPRA